MALSRREAIALLTSIPGVGRIGTVSTKPGPPEAQDVIVIESDRPVGPDERERIANMVREVWPGRRVLILDGGARLKIAP